MQDIPEQSPLTPIYQEHIALERELDKVEELHKAYHSAIHEANKLQHQLSDAIQRKLRRLADLKKALAKAELHSDVETTLKHQIQSQLEFRNQQIKRFKDTLPKTGELYLRVILGSFDVNLIEKDDRFKYKEKYERFKLVTNIIIFIMAIGALLLEYRAMDALLHFLLVWYHCTLTIRESILIANGSRIKGWWRALQFITTIQAGIMIVWPDGEMYNEFRSQFWLYTIYTAFLQYLQFYYQHSCLYRLRALGERYDMDVTIQGFHSWMWKGLSFLLPFLYFGYGFQFYNAYTLYQLWDRPECQEWQVFVTCMIFAIIFLGNMITTTMIVQQKIREGFYTALASKNKNKNE